MSKDKWKGGGGTQIDQEDKSQIWTSMDKKDFLDVKAGRMGNSLVNRYILGRRYRESFFSQA